MDILSKKVDNRGVVLGGIIGFHLNDIFDAYSLIQQAEVKACVDGML